jgi:carbon-monoxide dehydrogenase small subunit
MAEEEKAPPEGTEGAPAKISRRDFLVGAGAGVVVTGAAAAGYVAMQQPQIVEVVKEILVEVPVAAPVEETVAGPVTTLPANLRAVSLNIDGKAHELVVDVRESLWETVTHRLGMRDHINLGCDRAQCGACAVLVDGYPVNGCTVLSARLGRGQQITTIAGISTGTTMDTLHPVAKAFWQEGGYQCGICTRGFVMTTYALLQHNPSPTEADIREALAGNICRCGEYAKMYNAVFTAAEEMRSSA